MKKTFANEDVERWDNESGTVFVVISRNHAVLDRIQYYSVLVNSNGKGKAVASRATYETAMAIVKSYEQ